MKEDTKDKKLKAIVYTDGSAIPNPGKAGGGIHGYIYDTNNKSEKTENKPSRYVITNSGYKDIESSVNGLRSREDVINNKSLLKFGLLSYVVNPVMYIEGIYSNPWGTNNIAELMAIVETVNFIVNNKDKLDVKEILIYTDSQYAINAVVQTKKQLNNPYGYWVGRANSEQLKILNAVLILAKNANIKIELEWVKGHASSIGNIKADLIASIARIANKDNKVNTKNINYYTPADYYFKPKIHPAIIDNASSIMHFKGEILKNQEDTFILAKKDKDDKDMTEGKYLKNSSYVIIPIDYETMDYINMDNLINKMLSEYMRNMAIKNLGINENEYDEKSIKNAFDMLVVLNINEIMKSDAWGYIYRFGIENCLSFVFSRTAFKTSVKIVGEVAYHNSIATIYCSETEYAIDVFTDSVFLNYKRLVNSVAKDNSFINIDITDKILKDNKLILSKDKLEAVDTYNNVAYKISLIAGINFPELNVLKKLEKKINKIVINGLDNSGEFTINIYIDVEEVVGIGKNKVINKVTKLYCSYLNPYSGSLLLGYKSNNKSIPENTKTKKKKK